MQVKKLTFFLLLLIAPHLHAEDPKPPLAPLPQSVSKQQWLAYVQSALPDTLCKDDQFFIKCFETTRKECVDFTTELVRACLNNITLGLPDQIDKEKGIHWGQLVARCSYDLYDKFMDKKKKPGPECMITKPPEARKP